MKSYKYVILVSILILGTSLVSWKFIIDNTWNNTKAYKNLITNQTNMEKIDIKVTLTRPEVQPEYTSTLAAGADVKADINEPIQIAPGERRLIPTGVSMSLPDGYEAQLRPRSGLALKKGLTILNTPGTIDADYRGMIGAVLINHGYDTVTINPLDRIGQLVICKVPQGNFILVGSLDETERGDGGFGHSDNQ